MTIISGTEKSDRIGNKGELALGVFDREKVMEIFTIKDALADYDNSLGRSLKFIILVLIFKWMQLVLKDFKVQS